MYPWDVNFQWHQTLSSFHITPLSTSVYCSSTLPTHQRSQLSEWAISPTYIPDLELVSISVFCSHPPRRSILPLFIFHRLFTTTHPIDQCNPLVAQSRAAFYTNPDILPNDCQKSWSVWSNYKLGKQISELGCVNAANMTVGLNITT